jgi:hypothetical protein
VCVNPLGDLTNCGACGVTCSTLNATPMCLSGGCAWGCTSGYQHCMTGNTGCDTQTTTLTNCGGCNNVCDTTTSTNAMCDGTTCSYTCKPGMGDCVTTAPNTNGCETDLVATGEKMCGAMCILQSSCCTVADCTSAPGPAACFNIACSGAGGTCSYNQKANSQICGGTCCNGINGTCAAGTCALTCTPGYADCNGDPSDGCEVNLAATSQKLCGTTCVAQSTCCNAGDCSAVPAPTACFTPMCSGVGGSCSYPQTTGSQICGATCCLPINGTCNGDCSLACSSGQGDCDLIRSNGCEATLNTTTNCTACGSSCDTTYSTGAACTGITGKCTYTGCVTTPVPHINCDTTGLDTNGCECVGNASLGCCGVGTVTTAPCQMTHSNGNGQSYYDCVPQNTDDQTEATRACEAWGGVGNCSALFCGGAAATNVMCNAAGAKNCVCWAFASTGSPATVKGHLKVGVGTGLSHCLCPQATTDPTWN